MSKIVAIIVAAFILSACTETPETQERTQAIELYQPYLESKYIAYYIDDVLQFRFFFDGTNATMVTPPADPDQVLQAFGVMAHFASEYEAEIRLYTVAPE